MIRISVLSKQTTERCQSCHEPAAVNVDAAPGVQMGTVVPPGSLTLCDECTDALRTRLYQAARAKH